MSGAMFEGLDSAVIQHGHASYIPGEPGYHPSIVDDILTDVMRVGGHYFAEEWRRVLQDEYVPRFRLFGSFDGQFLLDDIVRRYADDAVLSGMPDASPHPINDCLNPLLQALYDAGQNCLSLDMSGYPLTYGRLPDSLSGLPGAPLLLKLITGSQMATFASLSKGISVVRTVGQHLDHVVLNVVGSAYFVGDDCRNSDLTLDGHARKMGYGSSDCTFRLEGAEKAGVQMHAKHQWESSHDGTAFTLHFTRGGICWGTDLPLEFWDEGNTLLVPDGTGGWTEVRP